MVGLVICLAMAEKDRLIFGKRRCARDDQKRLPVDLQLAAGTLFAIGVRRVFSVFKIVCFYWSASKNPYNFQCSTQIFQQYMVGPEGLEPSTNGL